MTNIWGITLGSAIVESLSENELEELHASISQTNESERIDYLQPHDSSNELLFSPIENNKEIDSPLWLKNNNKSYDSHETRLINGLIVAFLF